MARQGWDLTRAYPWFVAIVVFLTFAAVGFDILNRLHPHEDAYILFRYAEHVAEGRGIVFNSGGPPTEGSTDFLWLMLLSASVAIGLDVAIAALALNAMGASAVAFAIAVSMKKLVDSPEWLKLPFLALPVGIVLSNGALASYLGFGTMLYSALAVALYLVAVDARTSATIPVLALILALFRPEGVVIALGFVVVWFCLPMPPGRRCFGFWCLGCGAIAVGYFLWRYSYFGLWFPLPVYVKARIAEPGTYYHVPAFLRDVASVMTGLEWSLEWLTIRQSPLPALAVIALASAWSWSSHRREVMRSLVFLLPFTLLFASLLMVQQVQNVHWRFQAPITLVLFTALARAAAWVWAQERRGRSRTLLAIAILIVAVLPLGRGVRTLSSLQSATAGSYIDTFAPWLGAQLSRTDVIALTEAGRIPYWSSARVEDVIGLNSAEFALSPPSVQRLADLDPDIVMWHHGGTLDGGLLRRGAPKPVVEVEPARLHDAVEPAFAAMYEQPPSSYDQTRTALTVLASIVLTKYVVERGDFRVLAVDYRRDGTFRHIYAVRRDWALADSMIEALAASFEPDAYRSYLDFNRCFLLITPPNT